MNLPRYFSKDFCLDINYQLLVIEYKDHQNNFLPVHVSTVKSSSNLNKIRVKKRKHKIKTTIENTTLAEKVLKDVPPNPAHFSDGFLHAFYLSQYLKTCFARIIQVIEIMSLVIYNTFLKAIVFFALLVAISFSFAFALLISELVILNYFGNNELNPTISI